MPIRAKLPAVMQEVVIGRALKSPPIRRMSWLSERL